MHGDGHRAVLEQAREWLADDPDEVTSKILGGQIASASRGDAAALDVLATEFAGPLHFGTAGLRAALGPGPSRFNRVVVLRAAAGVAAWVLARDGAGSRVLIGHDARHGSAGGGGGGPPGGGAGGVLVGGGFPDLAPPLCRMRGGAKGGAS
ncbi:MAG: hypothetical protein ABF648_11730, partial [Propionibacterium sp.]